MIENILNQLNPKPRLNLNWYKNEDLYSEGDIEDKIIEMIAENDPEEYVDSVYDNFSWSTYYHLSRVRQNILNWYPFEKESEVLEIGCGMGAITGMLCDRVKKVTAVELSKRRATAAQLRCREKENLEIIVGNLNDIVFNEKYDYITLIGVLEYQGDYTNTENPYLDFLKKIKGLLKPTGKLLIAIENQFGLKYWCGAREDHTAIPFDGINNYSISKRKVRTFSRKGLEKLVNDAGFKHSFFYYPMPDYKLPSVIYSDKCKPSNGNMQNMNLYYIPDRKTLVVDEKKVWEDVVENDVFAFFANSFLVECSEEKTEEHITFASLNTSRLGEYRIGTRFLENRIVEKFAITQAGKTHLDTIEQNERELCTTGIKVLSCIREKDKNIYEYRDDCLLENKALRLLKDDRIQDFEELLARVYDEILKSSELVESKDNIIFTFGLEVPRDEKIYGPILKKAFLDMILRNAFDSKEGFIWFDQEWTLENTPATFVMYRLIKELWSSYPEIEKKVKIGQIAAKFGFVDLWDTYGQIESLFMGAVIDQKYLAESYAFCR